MADDPQPGDGFDLDGEPVEVAGGDERDRQPPEGSQPQQGGQPQQPQQGQQGQQTQPARGQPTQDAHGQSQPAQGQPPMGAGRGGGRGTGAQGESVEMEQFIRERDDERDRQPPEEPRQQQGEAQPPQQQQQPEQRGAAPAQQGEERTPSERQSAFEEQRRQQRAQEGRARQQPDGQQPAGQQSGTQQTPSQQQRPPQQQQQRAGQQAGDGQGQGQGGGGGQSQRVDPREQREAVMSEGDEFSFVYGYRGQEWTFTVYQPQGDAVYDAQDVQAAIPDSYTDHITQLVREYGSLDAVQDAAMNGQAEMRTPVLSGDGLRSVHKLLTAIMERESGGQVEGVTQQWLQQQFPLALASLVALRAIGMLPNMRDVETFRLDN